MTKADLIPLVLYPMVTGVLSGIARYLRSAKFEAFLADHPRFARALATVDTVLGTIGLDLPRLLDLVANKVMPAASLAKVAEKVADEPNGNPGQPSNKD